MEIRKDYLLERWCIISEGRAKRPNQFLNEKKKDVKKCVFCSGNESETPNEIEKIEKNGSWKVRVIPNKFSAVDSSANPEIQTHNQYYTFGSNFGNHEVIIETPEHGKKFGEIDKVDIEEILKVYAKRIDSLQKNKGNKYVCLFKNEGKSAGASIEHTHSQIVSLSIIPPDVLEKLNVTKKHPSCPYCDIISKEKDSYRRCFENGSFISFAPYCSRLNFEVWIFPRKHIRSFSEFDSKIYSDLASMLKEITQKLEKEEIDYDIAYYYSPEKEDLHFHIEVLPRTSTWAGLELGFGVDIITTSPETAAKFYRGE